MFRKKRRRKRPLEDAHSYLSGLAVLVYVVAEDVAVAVDFEEGEEDEEKREEEEEARTLVSVWISKGEGRYFPAKMKGRFFSSCRLFEHPIEKKKKKKNFIVFFPPFEPFAPGLPRFLR